MAIDYFQRICKTPGQCCNSLYVFGTSAYTWKCHNVSEGEANPISDAEAIMIKYVCSYFLDLIAIPDFDSGAMENWGLVTYKETSLLFDTSTSSASDQLWVTKVIAHELAHQVPNTHDILLASVQKALYRTPAGFLKQHKLISFYP